MALSKVRNMDLGLYLKIVSLGGVYNNLYDEYPLWQAFMAKMSQTAVGGGEIRWNLRKTIGPAAFQGMQPSGSTPYPKGQKSELVEPIGYFHEFGVTIEIPIPVLEKAQSKMDAYSLTPIKDEVDQKTLAARQQLSSWLARDGSGVIGEVASVTVDTAADTVTVTLKATDTARSFAGWFLQDDKIKVARENSGEEPATVNAGADEPDYWKVTAVDHSAQKVTLKPYTASDAAIDITVALSGTDIQADDFMRRYDTEYVDIANISGDYGLLTVEFPGIESLGADDGRLLHNVTMSGNLAGTRYDCGNTPISFKHMQKAMSKLKKRVGQNRYRYKQAFMSPEAYDNLVESQQDDRRFYVATDNTLGVSELRYIHKKDSLCFETDEFIRHKRIYILPEKIGKDGPLEYIGSELNYEKADNGGPWHLKVDSNGRRLREVEAFMVGCGLPFSRHAASILTIHNFTTP